MTGINTNVSLKDGTELNIRQYTAPSADLLDTVIPFLAHKGSAWLNNIRSRLNGDYTESTDYFFLGYMEGKPVSHLWLTVSKEIKSIALTGHIYTCKKYRRRGISGKLLDTARRFFFDTGGKVIVLQTTSPAAYEYYRKYGYKTLAGNPLQKQAAVMYTEKEPGLLNALKEQEKNTYWVERRELSTGDLPALMLLYSINGETAIKIKNRPQGVLTGYETEAVFGSLFRKSPETGRPVFINRVETGENLIRSIITVRRRTISIERILDFDFFLLPGFEEGFYLSAGELFAELENFPELILEYQGCDKHKFEILKKLGFTIIREETDYYLYHGNKIAASVFRKNFP
ncbi:MAG: GNAT family N-acetyltransferase [Spirochaetes bacterium]|nr:GNAT family N-acetyltransferase [Spirochaetota bacterium]